MLRSSVRDATADITATWLVILLVALTATVGFGLHALWLARWALRPLADAGMRGSVSSVL